MQNKDSIKNTFVIAIFLSLVCSVFISTSFVMLKDRQDANRKLDVRKNILQAADLLTGAEKSAAEINRLYEERVSSFVVDFETGERVPNLTAETYNQRKATKNPAESIALTSEQDPAGLKRRANYGVVYAIKENNEVALYIIPISGYGLWSTLYGFLALSPNAKVIKGITFYEHGETPGLGGEVDNPKWKALFKEKTSFDESGNVKITVLRSTAPPDSTYEVDGLSGSTFTSRGVDNALKFWLGENGYGNYFKKYLLTES